MIRLYLQPIATWLEGALNSKIKDEMYKFDSDLATLTFMSFNKTQTPGSMHP